MKRAVFSEKGILKSTKKTFPLQAALFPALILLASLLFSACSHEENGTKDPALKPKAETEAISVAEICLRDFKPDNEDGICVAGYNENGHGVVYSTYRVASEDHRAENEHYYLERYETDLLTDAFWSSEPVAVHSGQKGEINGMDWYGLWIRFYGLHKDDTLHAEEQWNPTECIGFWHTAWEQPILMKLAECSTDYQNVQQYKDKGIFSLLQTEYEILGTKEQLLDNVPSGKK
ncbi:MAG: hypothetical protein IKG97_07515 [Lachnospiraceae bacterium]|nr:hypothetical protein [Lachnospiraceae bacterium]